MIKRYLLFLVLGVVCCLPLQAADNVYGPINRQDTLWNIANQLRPSKSVTTQQVIMALYQKNPHAFTVNNISSLRKGAYLLPPTVAEVQRIKRKTAITMVKRHNSRWKKRRFVKTNAAPPEELTRLLAARNTESNTAGTESKNTAAVAQSGTQQNAPTNVVNAKQTTSEPASLAEMPAPVKQTQQAIANGTKAGQDALSARLSEVQDELAKTKAENQRLNAELAALKQAQQQNASQSTTFNDGIQVQLDALKHELAELRTILDEKNNHIKVLQASLKDASAAIKSQHADNMRLYNKLKELSPESVAAMEQIKQQRAKPQLELAEVRQQTAVPTQPATVENDTGIAKVWADEVAVADTNNTKPGQAGGHAAGAAAQAGDSVTLSQLLTGQIKESVAGQEKTSGFSFITTGRSAQVSPVAWAAVLLSFVFILFMIVRALLMQSEIRRLELDEA